jgi:hypothetical protein
MNEHDCVVLARPIPELGLKEGDVGAIVFVYEGHHAYEVEFVSGDGVTLGVLTLVPKDVRPLAGGEILHARKTSA